MRMNQSEKDRNGSKNLLSSSPNETWHIYCGMTRLHRSNNGLLAQELVSGQQTSKY